MNLAMNFLHACQHHHAEMGSCNALVELCPQQVIDELGLLVLVSRVHGLVLEYEV